MFKGKIATIGIIIATLILAGVAVFTGIRLYQLRQESITPIQPSSKPKAVDACGQTCSLWSDPQVTCPTGYKCQNGFCRNENCPYQTDCTCDGSDDGGGTGTNSCTALAFTLTTPSGSPTPTPTGSVTPTPTGSDTPTPTPTETATPSGTPNTCNGTCGSNSNCDSSLFCYSGYCRNSSCPNETDCSCTSTTSTPTSTSQITTISTPAPTEPSLPEAGTSLPTIFGIGLGVILLLGAILLAL